MFRPQCYTCKGPCGGSFFEISVTVTGTLIPAGLKSLIVITMLLKQVCHHLPALTLIFSQ